MPQPPAQGAPGQAPPGYEQFQAIARSHNKVDPNGIQVPGRQGGIRNVQLPPQGAGAISQEEETPIVPDSGMPEDIRNVTQPDDTGTVDIPEKFLKGSKSIQEAIAKMAASYSELEKKQGKPKEEAAPEPGSEAPPKIGDEEAPAAETTTEALPEIYGPDKFGKALSDYVAGKLKDESIVEYTKTKPPKEVVVQFFELAKQNAFLKNQNALLAMENEAGGQENLKRLLSWAKTALSKEERDLVNSAIDSRDTSRIRGALRMAVARNGRMARNAEAIRKPLPQQGQPTGSIRNLQDLSNAIDMDRVMYDHRGGGDHLANVAQRLRDGKMGG